MAKTYLGVDIGANELHLALVSGETVRCLPPEPIPDNLIKDGRIISYETMAEVLRLALKKNRVTTKACALVLPPELAFTRRCVMPYMTIEQLELNLPYEFHDYIQKDKDMYFYDYAVLSVGYDETDEPKTLEVLAAAVTKETIGEYRRLLAKAGLKLEIAIPDSFAYRNLILHYEKKHPEEHPTEYCLVDLGHTAIRVHMFHGDAYETTRVIDFGGAAIDQLISEAKDVDLHVAVNYKISNYEGVQEMETCMELYRRISLEIMRAINFYGYNNPDSSLHDVYFCGGLTQVERLMDTIRQTLEMNLHEIHVMMPQQAVGDSLERYATAVGVALQ